MDRAVGIEDEIIFFREITRVSEQWGFYMRYKRTRQIGEFLSLDELEGAKCPGLRCILAALFSLDTVTLS